MSDAQSQAVAGAALPLASRLAPAAKFAAWTLSGAALIALSAHIVIPLPFTPVPVTGQTLAVLVVGALLGSRRGTAAAAAYLGAGCLGLPVFASGSQGIARLLGATGGYLLGFIAAAWLIGLLAERRHCRSLAGLTLSLAAATAAIYLCGLPWLACYTGWKSALPLGLFPFLLGDAAKILIALAIIYPFTRSNAGLAALSK